MAYILMFFCFISVRRPSCQKGYFLKCFVVKYCNRYLRLCRCNRFTKKYGDEAEFYNHLNDGFLETPEDEAENFDETSKSILTPVHCNK